MCEGLEYALLGEVEEAGAKRIVARTYLANLHAGRFVEPDDFDGEHVEAVVRTLKELHDLDLRRGK